MDIQTILLIIAGLVLLFFGRRFFWLLVGVTGFVIGYTLAAPFVGGEESNVPIALGVVAGIAGALLAVFAQKIAVHVGGFLAGGYVTSTLVRGLEITAAFPDWVPFLIGGVLGALLLKQLFEWTVLVLTAVVGATIVVGRFGPVGNLSVILVVILAVVGVVFQARSKGKKKKEDAG